MIARRRPPRFPRRRDEARYERRFLALCAAWHPAVAAILAHEDLAADARRFSGGKRAP